MTRTARRRVGVGLMLGFLGVWAATHAVAEGGIHPGELWVAWDGVPGYGQTATAIAVHPTGRLLYVTGDNAGDWYTVAYQAGTGRRAWSATSRLGFFASDVAVSPDGSRVFVTGFCHHPVGEPCEGVGGHVLTIAYDAMTGAQVWSEEYGLADYGDSGVAVAVSPDSSRLYVGADVVYAGPAWHDYTAISYDARTGELDWTFRYDGGHGNDFPLAMDLDRQGTTLYLTGYSLNSGPWYNQVDMATVAVDVGTGQQAWASRYDVGFDDIGEAVAVSPDGSRVFVTSWSGGDYMTVAYSADSGEQQWDVPYDDAGGGDLPRALAVSGDGATVFVTGQSDGAPTPEATNDWATVAYDAASGVERWVARLNDPALSDVSAASAIGPSPDGSMVYVAGNVQHEDGLVDDDYLTVAYDAGTGRLLGSAGVRTDYDDHPTDLVVALDGSRIFVTGTQQGNSGLEGNYLTAAYEADVISSLTWTPGSG